MSGSNDTKEDHGSGDTESSQDNERSDGGHSGHGSASALARFRSQRQEWPSGTDGDEGGAAGGGGQ